MKLEIEYEEIVRLVILKTELDFLVKKGIQTIVSSDGSIEVPLKPLLAKVDNV